MLNLDTHILIGLVSGQLTQTELRCIQSDESAVSDIVLWEISKLHQKIRIGFGVDEPKFVEILNHLTIFPITVDIARQSCEMDFNSDPADEIIAATSVIHQIPLLTRDGKIRKSKLVKFPHT